MLEENGTALNKPINDVIKDNLEELYELHSTLEKVI